MNGLTMIQPLLHAYNVENEGPPEAVLLELSSRHPDRILLLDSFFNLVIWHGRNIKKYREEQIWVTNPTEYSWFEDWLFLPREEANNRAIQRFPYPNIIACDEGSGQERFLLAKLNPDNTNAEQNLNPDEMAIGDSYTDDVPLKIFMQHLKKLSVNEQ